MQGRWIRLKPNVPLHVVGQVLVYLAPLIMILGLGFGAWTIAAIGASLFLLGRLPVILVQEQNLLASRVESDIRLDENEIVVDGERIMRTSEIREAYASPRNDKPPTVRIYGKNKLISKLDIEVANFDQANELLGAIGFAPDQKPATFTTLVPKLLQLAPFIFMAPVLAFMPIILHHHAPHPFLMQQMLVIMAVAFTVLRIPRRVVVRPDGIETTVLDRFRKWYPFTDVTKVTRTLASGSFKLASGETVPLRTTTMGVALTDGQRSNDQLVERVCDAYDAFALRERPDAPANIETRAAEVPAEVTVMRLNWPGWAVPIVLFFGGMTTLVVASRLHADSLLVPVGAALVAALAAHIYMSMHPHRLLREKVSVVAGGLMFGDAKVEASLLENAYVQPKVDGPSLGTPKAYRDKARVVFTGKKRRDSISILVDDEAEGRAILNALALDPARAVSTFKVRAGLFANETVRVVLVVAPVVGLQMIRFTHGPGRVLFLLFIALSWVNAFWPTKMQVGVDGVFIKSLRRSRFFPFSDIERIEQSKNGVVLFLKSQRRVDIRTSTGNAAAINVESGVVLRRLQEGLAYARKNTTGNIAYALARGTLPTRAWIDQLRALGKGEATDYRVAAVDTNDLWRVVEDPSLHEEERIAAAVALRVDDEAASRLRVAASLSASPKLQTALQAAADRNEELLERALEESEAGEDVKGTT